MTLEDILPLQNHPDAETLREFDHPPHSLEQWVGVLIAKAWIGDDLACFFTGAERSTERFVLVFKASNAYLAGVYGGDMRAARVGSTYEMDVFVTEHFRPIIDRIERAGSFS